MMIRKTICDSIRHFTLFVFISLMTLPGCRKPQPGTADSSYQEMFDQKYGNDSLQQFDLFLPESRDRNTRMIILIHGGGWVSGEKEYVDYYARRFADAGYAAASMNYRLANDSVHYRDMLDDVDSMVSYITRNALQWNIGSGKIALFGYSAGGHLALLYSYSRDKGQKAGPVISLAGPTDVQDSLLWVAPGLYEEIKLMAGDPSPINWAQASPVNFTNASNASTLLIHGANDSVVPVTQSLKLNALLEESGARVSLLTLENETHYFSSAATGQFLDETIQFLSTNTK